MRISFSTMNRGSNAPMNRGTQALNYFYNRLTFVASGNSALSRRNELIWQPMRRYTPANPAPLELAWQALAQLSEIGESHPYPHPHPHPHAHAHAHAHAHPHPHPHPHAQAQAHAHAHAQAQAQAQAQAFRYRIRLYRTNDLYLFPIEPTDNIDPLVISVEPIDITREEYEDIQRHCEANPHLHLLPYKTNKKSLLKAITMIAGMGLGYYFVSTVGESLKELVGVFNEWKLQGFPIQIVFGFNTKFGWSDYMFL
ncbi:hypothetical protein P3S67_027232 [Capsicum chacoense]